jgi:hypothetical protein
LAARPGIGLLPAIPDAEILPSSPPAASTLLRRTNRRKDGQDHRSFSAVENRRLSSRRQAAWRKTLEDAVASLQVRLRGPRTAAATPARQLLACRRSTRINGDR